MVSNGSLEAKKKKERKKEKEWLGGSDKMC